MNSTAEPIELDVALIGGGIAGLWLLDRLRTAGYQVALFSAGPLGREQTLASQGMIHGGMKYTLGGALSGASEAVADMPELWRNCLAGAGEVDLSRTGILSDHFYMWSGSTLGKLAGFFASRTLRGRVETVAANDRPALLQAPGFSGTLYRLVDMVLDVPSLLDNLASNNAGHIFELTEPARLIRQNNRAELTLQTTQGALVVRANQWVLSAGKGNGALLDALGCTAPAMQLRPLKQVVVRHSYPYTFYGHCLGLDKTPRLTISSHPGDDGKMVWYLGGSLAEKGAGQTDAKLIAAAKQELADLFPWLSFTAADTKFSVLAIERAEPRQPNLTRPDQAFAEAAEGIDNVIAAWPTKLTLAPDLARRVMALLPPPGAANTSGLARLQTRLPAPTVGPLPWEPLV